MKKLKVRIKFIREVLGTQIGDEEVYRNYIGSKSPDAKTIEEEIEAVGCDDVVDKGKTFFPRVDNKPFIYDYQIRGFFKSACSAMSKVSGSLSSGMKAFKKNIDLRVFVEDRYNFIENITEISELQRPLRANTAQGERISLAISEMINAGATCDFTIICLVDSDIKIVKEWLDYGRFNGFLQWRNAGYGSFTWEEIK